MQLKSVDLPIIPSFLIVRLNNQSPNLSRIDKETNTKNSPISNKKHSNSELNKEEAEKDNDGKSEDENKVNNSNNDMVNRRNVLNSPKLTDQVIFEKVFQHYIGSDENYSNSHSPKKIPVKKFCLNSLSLAFYTCHYTSL